MQKKSESKNKNIIIISCVIIILIALVYLVIDYNRSMESSKQQESVKESPLGKFDPKKPQITTPLKSIPGGAVSIKISNGQFDPSGLTVDSGEVVSLVLTGIDGTHGLVFEGKTLEQVKIYVGRGESRGISFVAPRPGDYNFYCDIPGHSANEKGVMHVK